MNEWMNWIELIFRKHASNLVQIGRRSKRISLYLGFQFEECLMKTIITKNIELKLQSIVRCKFYHSQQKLSNHLHLSPYNSHANLYQKKVAWTIKYRSFFVKPLVYGASPGSKQICLTIEFWFQVWYHQNKIVLVNVNPAKIAGAFELATSTLYLRSSFRKIDFHWFLTDQLDRVKNVLDYQGGTLVWRTFVPNLSSS
jgi:hypothetical protein